MKHLIKLAAAKTPAEKRKVCHDELCSLPPTTFTLDREGHTIEVRLTKLKVVLVNGQELLHVVARVKRDGTPVEVDNPLFYRNPPMMVADGTFETLADGSRVANFIENPAKALRQIVLETLKVTSLKA